MKIREFSSLASATYSIDCGTIAARRIERASGVTRSPKIAVPIRTQFAPAAIASSKSADIPIERLSSAKRLLKLGAQRRELREPMPRACALRRQAS